MNIASIVGIGVALSVATPCYGQGTMQEATPIRVSYHPIPYLALDGGGCEVLDAVITGEGELTCHAVTAEAVKKELLVVGPVKLSPVDMFNLQLRVDQVVETIPTHFYGGGGGAWRLSLVSSSGRTWGAGSAEREQWEEIRSFETYLVNLVLRKVRDHEAQHEGRNVWRVIDSWTVGTSALGFCFLVFVALYIRERRLRRRLQWQTIGDRGGGGTNSGGAGVSP